MQKLPRQIPDTFEVQKGGADPLLNLQRPHRVVPEQEGQERADCDDAGIERCQRVREIRTNQFQGCEATDDVSQRSHANSFRTLCSLER